MQYASVVAEVEQLANNVRLVMSVWELSEIFTFKAFQSRKYRFSGGKAVLYSSKSGTFPLEKYRFSFCEDARR